MYIPGLDYSAPLHVGRYEAKFIGKGYVSVERYFLSFDEIEYYSDLSYTFSMLFM